MSKCALFVCDVLPSKTEGIFKKVSTQTAELSKIYGECHFLSKNGGATYHALYIDGQVKLEEVVEAKLYSKAKAIVEKGEVEAVYVRHMLPTISHITFLASIKKKKIKVFYEIPTYPYFAEQINNSTHKLRTALRVAFDIVMWPSVYSRITKLVVIRSNTKVRIYKKMHISTNGINTANMIDNSHVLSHMGEVHLAIVGTLYRYHGVDRLIDGIENYYVTNKQPKVYLHIIGESQEIRKLHQVVVEKHLGRFVIFHGQKTTAELNDLFNEIDLGVACIALYRRNADTDTTLKLIEYLCRGIPVLTSGYLPIESGIYEKVKIVVPNKNGAVDIADVINRYNEITLADRKKARERALQDFDWSTIMRRIIDEETI